MMCIYTAGDLIQRMSESRLVLDVRNAFTSKLTQRNRSLCELKFAVVKRTLS